MSSKLNEDKVSITLIGSNGEEVFESPFDGFLYFDRFNPELGLYEIAGMIFPNDSVPHYRMTRYNCDNGSTTRLFVRFSWIETMFKYIGTVRNFDHGPIEIEGSNET